MAQGTWCATCGATLPPTPAPRGGGALLWLGIIAVAFVVFLVVAKQLTPHVAATAASVAPVDGWYADARGYEAASSAQAASKQPMLVYFHTSWCGWCKQLELDVFGTPQFQSRYGNMLKVKIDAEAGSQNRSLTSDFSVTGYPTVFVVRGDGHREPLPGYSPPDVYFARIDEALR
jgi:thiol:disulfide interchange protein